MQPTGSQKCGDNRRDWNAACEMSEGIPIAKTPSFVRRLARTRLTGSSQSANEIAPLLVGLQVSHVSARSAQPGQLG